MVKFKVFRLEPSVLKWARERNGIGIDGLGISPLRVAEWESDGLISSKEAERLAEMASTPFAYLFLSRPWPEDEPLPKQVIVSLKEERYPGIPA